MRDFSPWRATALLALLLALAALPMHAQTGQGAWLGYARVEPATAKKYESVPGVVTSIDDSPRLTSAKHELLQGLHDMLGKEMRTRSVLSQEPAVHLGTLGSVSKIVTGEALVPPCWRWLLGWVRPNVATLRVSSSRLRLTAVSSMACSRSLTKLHAKNLSFTSQNEQSRQLHSMIDQWDNLDGTIERGYAGPSIFFDKGEDLTRASEYARLLASVGINFCAINNVNANPLLLDNSLLPQLRRIGDAFRQWCGSSHFCGPQ